MKRFLGIFWSILYLTLVLSSCQESQIEPLKVEGEKIAIEFNQNLHSRVIARFDNQSITLGDFAASEFVTVSGEDIKDFKLSAHDEMEISGVAGDGKTYIIIGNAPHLQKKVELTLYDEFPTMAVYQVIYTNIGSADLTVDRWVNHQVQITSKKGQADRPFWSFQSGSYESRPDWVLPLSAGFQQENYMGMNATDYGGGTPVIDVWRRDVGLAVGHLETVPKLVSLPVTMPDSQTSYIAVANKVNQQLAPGESLNTFRTFVNVHQGDYFRTLAEYRLFMGAQGINFDSFPETTYEPIWCAWGFERDFTMEQIHNAIPKVKEIGYKWVVLDDGWQTAEGDWYLDKNKFPGGDSDMKRLVDRIHAEGLKAKLWWAPLAVDPGTDLIKNHPEYLLLNPDGSKQDISWWDAYYLCPAHPEVQRYTKELVEKIIKVWGFDGLKIDGQHLNAAPPCFNDAHQHAYPEESFEKVPEFFKVIYEAAMTLKSDAVVEICPCGTAYSFFTMPYMNQPVASDPTSSWQIRLKGKTFKALMGSSVPYYGDHVELSDNKNDFASTVGIGGVIGTKFTWPVGAKKGSEIDLTPAKEKHWQKWLNIYQENILPKGEYLGDLYDIGFDSPECHAIKKDSTIYYAFYADAFKGEVELRGLKNLTYRIFDYVNEKDYGTVEGPSAQIPVEFSQHLLLKATPL